jgi:hypothetical protein
MASPQHRKAKKPNPRGFRRRTLRRQITARTRPPGKKIAKFFEVRKFGIGCSPLARSAESSWSVNAATRKDSPNLAVDGGGESFREWLEVRLAP